MAPQGIPPSPAEAKFSAEIWACQQRLVDKALAEAGSTALRNMSDYIDRQAERAVETSGDAARRWVDARA